MTKETISVGVANSGEKNLNIEEVKKWEPKDINNFGDTVYFRNEKLFYSMKRVDFIKIFGQK